MRKFGLAVAVLITSVLLGGVLSVSAQPSVTVGQSAVFFSTDDTLTVQLNAINPDTTNRIVDVYLVIQLPGNHFFSVLQDPVSKAVSVSEKTSATQWQPLISGVDMAPGFTLNMSSIISYTFIGGEPPGTYKLYAALADTGTLNIIDTISISTFIVGQPITGFLIPAGRTRLAIIENDFSTSGWPQIGMRVSDCVLQSLHTSICSTIFKSGIPMAQALTWRGMYSYHALWFDMFFGGTASIDSTIARVFVNDPAILNSALRGFSQSFAYQHSSGVYIYKFGLSDSFILFPPIYRYITILIGELSPTDQVLNNL